MSGFEGAPEGIQAILDGRMIATLNQGPFEQGGNIIDKTTAAQELKRFEGVLKK